MTSNTLIVVVSLAVFNNAVSIVEDERFHASFANMVDFTDTAQNRVDHTDISIETKA